MIEKIKKNKYIEREEREAAEMAAEEAAAEAEGKKIVRYSYIKNMTAKEKTKRVSFAVSPNVWAQFDAICKDYGMSNSSTLNMLIVKYVKENSITG